MQLSADEILPEDRHAATLVGRVWIDAPPSGPRTCVLRDGMLVDLSGLAPTLSQLFDLEAPAQAVRAHAGAPLGKLAEALARGPLPAPCDLQAVRAAEVRVSVEGADGYREQGTNSLTTISRDPAELVATVAGDVHQYPDGLMLFLGTMYVPHGDRVEAGAGFTHLPGDVVRIRSPRLGALVNQVTTADRAPPWTFGTRALMTSLAARGLL